MSTKNSVSGFGCGILFVLPFGLVGLGATAYAYYLSWNWQSAQSWVETPATITSIELKSSRSGKRGNSKSYKVIARYTYKVAGREYSSDKVSLYHGSDNIGSFHQNTYKKLKPLLNTPDAAMCFVNPKDASDALLVRNARWGMFSFLSIFGCLFGSVGLLGTLAMINGLRDALFTKSQQKVFAEEPWNWHPRWSNGQVRSEQVFKSRIWSFTAVWWVVATVPAAAFAAMALFDGDVWAVFGFITPGCALGITRAALKRRRQLREFGEAYLQIPDLPLRGGSEVTVAVVFPSGELPRDTVKTVVTCQLKTGRGKRRKTKTTWQDNQQVAVDDCRIIDGGLCIAVPVTIPRGAQRTSIDDDSVLWKLAVTIPTQAKPMTIDFQLPVF